MIINFTRPLYPRINTLQILLACYHYSKGEGTERLHIRSIIMDTRKQLSLRLEREMINQLKIYAVWHNMSLTMYIERIFKKHIAEKKQYE